MQHDVLLARGQLPVRHVEPDPELAGRVLVQPAGARVPRQDGAFLDASCLVGDEGAGVDLGPHAQAVAGRARAVGVEREGLGAGRLEARAAHGAHDLHALRRDRRPDEVAVRAQMRAQPGHHQPQDVRTSVMVPTVLRGPGTGGRWRSASAGGRWSIRSTSGRCAWAASGGCRCSAPPGSGACPRRRGSDGQRGLPGSGYADDGDGPPQRNVHVQVPQVVAPGAADLDGAGQVGGHRQRSRGPCGSGTPVTPPVQRALIRAHRSIRPLACRAEGTGAERGAEHAG